MLKLTNSFCRYLKFTCKIRNYHRAHVRTFSHLTNPRQTCCNLGNLPFPCFTTPFIDTGQQLRLYANIKKRFYVKRLTKTTNESKKSKQMSESLQPTLNHVSYGGQFEITTEDSSPGRWRKPLGDTGSTANKKETIPSDFRVWEQVLKKNDPSDGNAFKFKILSYNVLAQYLLECHPYLYTECAPYNLKWKVRAARLYDEIVSLAPDILCLQEVQASHINSFYSKFEKIGYYGVFKQKTGLRHDGCAIYFKQSLFELWDQVTVEYYQPALPILNRDNIGVMVKLMPKNYFGPPIVVATTHLLYNPQRTDVRLAQLQLLLAELDRFAFYNDGRETGHLPIILTGDFNSTPDSAVIKLLDMGHVSASPFRDSSDWKNIAVTDNCQHLSVYINKQEGRVTEFCMTEIHNTDYRASTPGPSRLASNHEHSQLFNSGVVSHSLNLTSTYTKYKPNGSQEATTFQDIWVTVDYIYFSFCSSLKLVERLRLPTADECGVLGRLPNDEYGSDHLALAAVFELTPRKSSL